MSDPVDTFTTQEQIDALQNTLSQKYLGNTEYILSSTENGTVSAVVAPMAPYANLTSRYYPTVATYPADPNTFVTESQLGGYFLPKNLGITVYLTKDIKTTVDVNQLDGRPNFRYIDPLVFNKSNVSIGDQVEEKDQDTVIVNNPDQPLQILETDIDTLVTHVTSPTWMYANNVTLEYDGNLINTSTFQKFIPYQSSFESTKSDSNGVVTAQDNFEFWNGATKNNWMGTLDKEQYFDLDSSIRNIVLTPGLDIYSWNTDIYGTQYALYKAPVLSSGYYHNPVGDPNTFIDGIGKIYRFHNGDFKMDGRIDTDELNNITLLYNYRDPVSSTRLGLYHNDPTTIDGFAPGPGIFTHYHDSDSNKDGNINLSDLLSATNTKNGTGSEESVYKKYFLPGVLWTKTLNNTVALASASLGEIFNKYKNNYTIYSHLSSNLILNFEVFLDTLVFELPSAVLYEKVYLDYNTYEIKPASTSYLPLTLDFTNNLGLITQSLTAGTVSNIVQTFYGGNWYDAAQKTITICTLLSGTIYTALSAVSGIVVPVLYELDLDGTSNRKRLYPNDTTDFTPYISSTPFLYIEAPVFTFNKDSNTYIVTHLAYGTSQKTNIINYKITL